MEAKKGERRRRETSSPPPSPIGRPDTQVMNGYKGVTETNPHFYEKG